MKFAILVLLTALLALSGGHAVAAPVNAKEVLLNDNRMPAGRLSRGVLTVALVASRAVWYPEGKQAAGLDI